MPVEIIPDKICPHCGGSEWYVSYSKDRDGQRFLCRAKQLARIRKTVPNRELARKNQKNHRLRYPDRHKLATNRWREKNKDRYVATMKKWQQTSEKYHTYMQQYNIHRKRKRRYRRYSRRRTERLTDTYVIHAIIMASKSVGHIITRDQITQEDINLYREGLIAKRKYREFINNQN